MPSFIDVLIPLAAVIWIAVTTHSPRAGESREDFLARQTYFRRIAGWLFWAFLIALFLRVIRA